MPHDRTLADIRRAFEDSGIEFLFDGAVGAGIRIKKLQEPVPIAKANEEGEPGRTAFGGSLRDM